MAIRETILDGVVIRRYDDDNQLYSEFDNDGYLMVGPIPYTDEQIALAQAIADSELKTFNEATIHDRARTALTQNSAWLGRSTAPTNAQTLAHIDRLTRQVNGLIRIEIRELMEIGDA